VFLWKLTSATCLRGDNSGYTSSCKGSQVFTLEDEYICMTRHLTFLQNPSPQVAITLPRISQDLEPEPGVTAQDQGPTKPSTTTYVHTRIQVKILSRIKIGIGTYSSI
jgi:hypothetical protein